MTENKGDLISREALKKSFEDTVCIEPMPYAFVKQIIDSAPTVEYEILTKEAYSDLCLRASKERPQGEWIEGYCNKCGGSSLCDGWGRDIESRFCPNCGAYMRGKKNERCNNSNIDFNCTHSCELSYYRI